MSAFLGTKAQETAQRSVKTAIDNLFSGMAKKDTALIKSALHPTARLQSAAYDKDGKSILKDETTANFLKQIATIPSSVNIEERVISYEYKIDENLASVWCPYQFYINGKLSHCGVDAFQLFKEENGIWKIIQITDTRKKDNCN